MPRRGGGADGGSSAVFSETPAAGAIFTGTSCGTLGSERRQSSLRQRNSWLEWMPAACDTSETVTPGSSVAATSRSFSARDQRRRRCTDVITSTRDIVIGLLPGLLPGLAIFVLSRQGGHHRTVTVEAAFVGMQLALTGHDAD